jgi:hypothetical protein
VTLVTAILEGAPPTARKKGHHMSLPSVSMLVDRLRSRWRGLPPAPLRQSVGPGDFEAIGRNFAGYLTRFAGLTSSSIVLDVGCGVGRIALPLTRMLRPPGQYEGFDIAPDAIA